jgi:hypothetical protein
MSKTLPLHSPIQFIEFEAVNSMISKCTVKVLYTGKNRNYSYISKEVAEKMIKTLPGTPVVGEYNRSKGDFLGHGQDFKMDEDGNVRPSRTTVPVGFVPENTKIWWSNYTEKDGTEKEYLCCEAYIWTGRYPETRRIVESGNNQSMEIDPATIKGEWSKLEKSGPEYFVIQEANFSALCVLGEDVEPCFEGAAFNPIMFSLLKNEENKEKFDSEMSELLADLQFALSEFKKEEITDFPNNGDNKEITLRNSQWPVFDPEFAANLKENHPEIWRLGGNIRGNSQYRKLSGAVGKSADSLSTTEKNAIELREAWIARHLKDFRIAGVIAQIKWLAIGSRGEKYMKDLVKEEIKKRAERKAKTKHSHAEDLANKFAGTLKKLDELANKLESGQDTESADALDLIITDLNKILDSMGTEDVAIQSDPNDQSLDQYTQKKEEDSLEQDKDLELNHEAAPSDDTGEDSKAQYEPAEEPESKEEDKSETKEEEASEEYAEEETSEDKTDEEDSKEEPATEHGSDEETDTQVADLVKGIEAMLQKLMKLQEKDLAENAPTENEATTEEEMSYEAVKAENEALKMELASLQAFKEAIDLKEKETMMEKFDMLKQDFLAKVRSNIDSYSIEELESVLAVEAVRSGAVFAKQDATVSYSLETETQDTPSWITALENLKK